MKVVKVGGGCLKGKKTIHEILDLVEERGRGNIFVVSALNGITDILIEGMAEALGDENAIAPLMGRLKNKHMLVARYIIRGAGNLKRFAKDLDTALLKLERYYYGLNFTGEISPKMRDTISSFGERISAELLSAAMSSRGVPSACRMPHDIGLVTDGKFGDASADLEVTRKNFKKHLTPLLKKKVVLFIPGFYGISDKGDITTFGRGGSDYSAAVATVAMEAGILEFWKDVAGFMSADPRIVSDAELIPVLSYGEAAELCYFGAKILHPRAVEPVRRYGLDMAIKSTLDPDTAGSLITGESPETEQVVKSVTQNTEIGILKIHASGVGARPGMLATVVGCVTDKGINIKSVVTSQTCISLLLDYGDLETGYAALNNLDPMPFRSIEKEEDVALLGVVGEGLSTRKGVAGRCFTAMDKAGVNVEMISFGPSRVALYFIVHKKDLKRAVRAMHKTFFA
ncbi:MAG: aspartate kinase [Desulfobacteraceae bacterium]|nr:aspartate kinase [Desulfobacteraceae bacterium]